MQHKKLNKLAYAIMVAGFTMLPSLTFGVSISPNNPPSDDPAERRQQMEQQSALALNFLKSPDSGVWKNADDSFRETTASFDPLGRLQARYKRYYKGLEILDSTIKVSVGMNGEVIYNYTPVSYILPKSLNPLVTSDSAWNTVARALGVERARVTGDMELAIYPLQDEGQAILVWRVRAIPSDGKPVKFYIDANSGKTIKRMSGISEALVESDGVGTKTGGEEVDIKTSWDNTREIYKMIDVTRGETQVRDMRDTVHTPDHHGDIYQDENNKWGNGEDWKFGEPTADETGQTAAVDAMWGAQRTWDTLLNVFSLEGYNGLAEPMILRVHIRKDKEDPYGDANFDDWFVNLGDGDTSDARSRTELSTVSHELGHGVWSRWVNLDNEGEARGLNEGHGDITSAVVAHYVKLAGGTGNTIPTNNYGNLEHFRLRMISPWSYFAEGQQGLAGYVPHMKHVEEHAQGTAYGHMFAILAMGSPSEVEFNADPCDPPKKQKKFTCLTKSPYPIGMVGIGMDKAAAIWHLATTAYFDDKPTFHEAREAWLKAAADLFGMPSPEYASVMNAFYVINVGEPAEDFGPPEVQLHMPIVDNNEKTVLVEVDAVDDIGVKRIDLSVMGTGKKIVGNHAKEYFYTPSVPGNYIAEARAYDANQNFTDASSPFTFSSANHLVYSDFDNLTNTEDGLDTLGWDSTNELGMFLSNEENAFLGDGYVKFSGDHWIEKQFDVPPEASELKIGFRYRVKENQGLSSGSLRVEIRDSQSLNLLEVVTLITADTDTNQDFSNHYKKLVYTALDSYAGQTVTLRFRSLASLNDVFRIDQVFVVYEATPELVMDIEVDETEGSVIFTPEIYGMNHNLVDYISIDAAGMEVAQDNVWPYQVIFTTSDFNADVLIPAVSQAYDHFGNMIDSSGLDFFEIKSINKLGVNGGFENGVVFWSLSGDANYCTFNPAAGEGSPAFLGIGCILFSGEGSIHQAFYIPDDVMSSKLSFRLRNETESGSDITFRVRVLDHTTGQEIAILDELPGYFNSDFGTSHNGYRKYEYSLTAYKGNNVRIQFEVLNPLGKPVGIFLDNVGASYTDYPVAPGGFKTD